MTDREHLLDELRPVAFASISSVVNPDKLAHLGPVDFRSLLE